MKNIIIIAGILALVSAVKGSNYTYAETYTTDPSKVVGMAVNNWNHPEGRVDLWDDSVSATSGSSGTVAGSITPSNFGADFNALMGDIINGPWGFMGGWGHSLSGTGENVAFGIITYNFTSNTNGGGFNSGAIAGYDKLWGGHQHVEEINSISGGWQISYSGNLSSIGAPKVTWSVCGFQLIATPQGSSAVGAITGVAISIDVYEFYNFGIQPTFIYESRNGQGQFDGNYGLAALALTHGW